MVLPGVTVLPEVPILWADSGWVTWHTWRTWHTWHTWHTHDTHAHMTHVLNCTFWTLLIHFVDLETSPGSLHVSTSSQSFGIYTCNPCLALAGKSNMNLVVSRTRPQVKHFEGLSRCPCRRDLNSCCFSCAESDRCGPSPSGNWKVSQWNLNVGSTGFDSSCSKSIWHGKSQVLMARVTFAWWVARCQHESFLGWAVPQNSDTWRELWTMAAYYVLVD